MTDTPEGYVSSAAELEDQPLATEPDEENYPDDVSDPDVADLDGTEDESPDAPAETAPQDDVPTPVNDADPGAVITDPAAVEPAQGSGDGAQ